MSLPTPNALPAPDSFIRRLILGVVIINLFVIALTALFLYDSRRHYRDRAEITAQNLTRVFAQSLTGTVEKIDLILMSVEEEVRRQLDSGAIDAKRLDSFLEQKEKHMPAQASIRAADENGTVRYGLAPGQATVDISGRTSFQAAMRSTEAGLIIETPAFSRFEKKWVLPLGRRLNKADSSFAGVVYTVVPLDYFTQSFAGLNIGANGSVTLRDKETGLITRFPANGTQPGRVPNSDASPQLQQAILEDRDGGVYTNVTPADRVERTVSYRKIAGTPLYIVVGLASSDYLAEWRGEVMVAILLIGIFMFMTVFMSMLLYRGWRRQNQALESLWEQKEFLHTIVEGEPECVTVTAPNGRLLQMNRAGLELVQADSLEEVDQVGMAAFVDPQFRDAYAVLQRRALQGEVGTLEYRIIGKQGSQRWVEAHASPLRNSRGQVTAVVTVARDTTERRASREKIEFLAYHDALTMLPNRVAVRDQMEQAMTGARRDGRQAALLFLDLDNFKSINDTLGHLLGDELLKMSAKRLRECLEAGDTLSRYGGDEFLIVLPALPSPDGAAAVAERILEQMKRPYSINGHSLPISFSIGIALYPDDGEDFEALLKNADTALFQAKQAGRNLYRFYAQQMNINAGEDLRMRASLSQALETGGFTLYYQPQISLASGKVIGAEALIRMHHPELGLVPPHRFIPVAEACGLIVPIGEWVIREACRQAVAWREAGLPNLVVAVNLSSVQFQRGDLEKSVIRALADTGMDPAFLELELTESILIQDTETVLETVRRLKTLGLKLSIDDFGTGYSSLAYLKRFSVDKLKIDQSFVRDMAHDPSDAAIVRAVIQVARSLNLATIAEGVEDERTVDLLNLQQCDQAQGYYFARPLPAEEFLRFVVERMPANIAP